MKITPPTFFLLIGLLITICLTFIPLIYDPVITKFLPIESIEKDQQLVDYHRSIQNKDNVIIGIHGYTHRCPVCGSTSHEYYSPNHETPQEIILERVKKGITVFQKAGLDDVWIAPPGMAYRDKLLGVTEAFGYKLEPYSFENPHGFKSSLQMILKPKSLAKIDKFKDRKSELAFKEYTWEWGRKSIDLGEYNKAKLDLEKEMMGSINGLLLHIQDYNNLTEAFISEALQKYSEIKFIRVDDIASNFDLPRLKKLVNLATENNRLILIAVIPAHLSGLGNPKVSNIIKTTWFVSIPFFIFPIAVMLPLHWYERGKVRKAKRKIPHSPKVSLILPAYNEEKLIKKAIEQGLKQDYKGELEVVIIDDGSTDRTFEIANKCVASHPDSIVKVYRHDKNMGKPAALNTGFHMATGEISIFSDTDSHLDSDLVSKMVPHFEDSRIGMVAGMIIVDNEINLLTKLQQIEYLYNQEIIRFCQTTHKAVLVCPGAATAVRTQIAREIPSTERTITEDSDFTLEVAKAGWKISQEPEAISRTEAPEKWTEFINQRKRWLYGVLQTMWIHKWSLFFKDTKIPNLWVWWAWAGYIICPITAFAVIAMPLFYRLIGPSYLIFLIFYSLLIGAIYGFAHWYGIKQYLHENKIKLILLLPVYVAYQYILNLLLVYLVMAFLFRKGITVRYGGRYIHAV